MAAPGFGFSIGDFIAGIDLIITCVQAVQESKGATEEFLALQDELQSLNTTLNAIRNLELEEHAGKESVAVNAALEKLQHYIDAFVKSVAKYQPWLQPGLRGWRASVKKIKWVLCKKDDVIQFHQRLKRHTSSIQTLLATVQIKNGFEVTEIVKQNRDGLEKVSASVANALQLSRSTGHNIRMTKQLLKGISKEQTRCLRKLSGGHQELLDEIRKVRALITNQRQLPPQVKFPAPVTLLDATGNTIPVHLNFIDSVEAFIAVMKVRFEQRGVAAAELEKLSRGEWVLEKDGTKYSRLSIPLSISRWKKPGDNLKMRMVFRRSVHDKTCPICCSKNPTLTDDGITCPTCGGDYTIVVQDWRCTPKNPEAARLRQLMLDAAPPGPEIPDELEIQFFAVPDDMQGFRRIEVHETLARSEAPSALKGRDTREKLTNLATSLDWNSHSPEGIPRANINKSALAPGVLENSVFDGCDVKLAPAVVKAYQTVPRNPKQWPKKLLRLFNPTHLEHENALAKKSKGGRSRPSSCPGAFASSPLQQNRLTKLTA